jgi:hypothetical protein
MSEYPNIESEWSAWYDRKPPRETPTFTSLVGARRGSDTP